MKAPIIYKRSFIYNLLGWVVKMSPRPRTVSDEEILAATARMIGRVGPLRLTLGHVAREVGLARPP